MRNELRRRTILSFAVLLAWIVGFISLWTWLNRQPLVDETPKPFRQVLELNGRLWQKMFDVRKRSECTPPPKGKKARLNGELGLKSALDPAQWSLTVLADVDRADGRRLTLTMKDLLALPRTDTATELKCIEGWSEDMAFAGVRFSDFVKAYGLTPKRYVGLETPDGEYYVSIDWQSMMHDQTLLAYEINGEPLTPEHGAPLRLVIPVKYGIKHLKRIGKIFFSDTRPPDYWAEQGYDWYAGL
jgi:DMSO/TMAO reductase YedYZ molybdopterin-dependent catalytic subunit